MHLDSREERIATALGVTSPQVTAAIATSRFIVPYDQLAGRDEWFAWLVYTFSIELHDSNALSTAFRRQ